MDQYQDDSLTNGHIVASAQPLDLSEGQKAIASDEYAAAYGEELSHTLDLDTWHSGDQLADLYQRLEVEVEKAVQQEDETRERVRQINISSTSQSPRGACRRWSLPNDSR